MKRNKCSPFLKKCGDFIRNELAVSEMKN